MIKILDKINDFIDKIGIRNFLLLIFVVFVFIVSGLFGTFSLFTTSSVEYVNGVKTYKFIIGDDVENRITVGAYDSKYLDITISNQEEFDLLYSLYYQTSDDVVVGVLKDSKYKSEDRIKANSDYTISLRVFNNTSTSADITFGVSYGSVDGGDVSVSGNRIFETIDNLDYSDVNEPVLDDNMIPVFYNEDTDEWVKADQDNMNQNYQWYDYSSLNKMWANAVVVTNDKKDDYLNSHVGTAISMEDILAFYVWIPKFSYRVWNVTRDIVGDYSYDARNNGIEITFGTNEANFNCNYNVSANTSVGELSDECMYNGGIVSLENDNAYYSYVYYTHPAFYYGNKEISGFWVGKFETTGTAQIPTVLPDKKSLVSQNISNQINTNNLISNYGFSKNVSVHILKNIEWGAVAYLTYSNYGICDKNVCHDIYQNNSSYVYTGRSSGDISNNRYNEYGNYDYRGYKISNNGIISTDKDKNKIASTTGNIYGVYDLSGGASEVVMANSLNSKYSFNKANSGLTVDLEEKYYDSYSYGRDNSNLLAIYRTVMGDAVGETSLLDGENIISWSSTNSKDKLIFVNDEFPWFVRGGNFGQGNSGLFKYSSYDGGGNNVVGFRTALS